MAKKKSIAQSQDASTQKPKAGNPWGQYRAPLAKLKRVGDEIIHAQKSSNTVSELQADYPMLLNEVQQLGQYLTIKKKRGSSPTADEVIKAFGGKAPYLLGDGNAPGYAAPKDIEEFAKTNQNDFRFARDLMAKAWNLERSAIDSYLKPGRKKNKKS